MEKYYYKHDEWLCLEKCSMHESAYIGSGSCMECENYDGGSRTEHYVICKHLQPKRKTNLNKILAIISYFFIMLFTIFIGLKFIHSYLFLFLYSMISGAAAYILASYLWFLSNKNNLK